ncbi:MAG: hypothetical protein SNJ78_09880 [Spirochaetales bacterium]
MKNFIRLGILFILFLVWLGSCASPPPPKEEVPPPPPPAPSVVTVPAPEAELKEAESLKQTIDTYNLSFAKPEEYAKANEELSAGKDAMGKDNARAKDLLVSAIKRYKLVLEAGIEQIAQKRDLEMQTAQRRANEVRAFRAVPDQYALAERQRAEAVRLFGEKKYLEAFQASEEAIAAYNKSYDLAREKRSLAEQKLENTAQVQAATTEQLQQVTKELTGGQP